LLATLGHRPAFPQAPHYCQLWATVTAGKILGHDVAKWKSDLAKETDRLEKSTAEYELTRRQLESDLAESQRRIEESEALMEAIARGELRKEDATKAIAVLQRRAIRQAQDEVDQALSRRLGY
jgi:predicted restriction endonuclease